MDCKKLLTSSLESPGTLRKTLQDALWHCESKLQYLISSHPKAKLYYFTAVFSLIFLYSVVIANSFIGPDGTLANYSSFATKYYSLAPLTVVLTIVLFEILTRFSFKTFSILLISNFLTLTVFGYLLERGHYKFTLTLIVSFYLLTILCNLLVWLLTRRLKSTTRTLIFLPLGVVIAFLISRLPNSATLMPNLLIIHFFRFAFVFTSLDPKFVAGSNKTSLTDMLAFVFSPTHLTTPIPINYSQWKVEDDSNVRWNLRSKAFLYFGVCLVFLFLMKQFVQLRSYVQNEISGYGLKWFMFGLVNYFYFFLFSYVNITIPIALLWWCGLKLPDAYDFPLLATNPQERWRRWNTYFYEWFFKYIYLPVYRRTSWLLAAVLIVFMVTFLMHATRYSDVSFFDYDTTPSNRNMARKYIFFIAHGVFVYIGLKYSNLWPDENRKSGWLGVLVMTLVMAFIHGIFLLI